eukprot:TRINITY_DN6517_c0_g1_i1.p1 TRINITY_DN6517_c0_g1~~TRINITY_DN6517_c0_g1_i1.p1  ORF type:complete len:322 (+),score=53.60 TRINITY_DN6517_c0_g1_i1:100-1065(+)
MIIGDDDWNEIVVEHVNKKLIDYLLLEWKPVARFLRFSFQETSIIVSQSGGQLDTQVDAFLYQCSIREVDFKKFLAALNGTKNNAAASLLRDSVYGRKLKIESCSEILEVLTGRGDSSFLPIRFLEVGIQLKSAVCKVEIPGSVGTGFLIREDVLMTNNHVINANTDLSQSNCIFDCDAEGVPVVQRRPLRLLHTHFDLDYSLVLLEPSPGRTTIPLRNTVVAVTRCISIGHPDGRYKKLSILKNDVVRHHPYRADDSILYLTDTMEGSSGSPIFTPDWTLVALHRAQVADEMINTGTKVNNIVENIRSLNNPDLTALIRS